MHSLLDKTNINRLQRTLFHSNQCIEIQIKLYLHTVKINCQQCSAKDTKYNNRNKYFEFSFFLLIIVRRASIKTSI